MQKHPEKKAAGGVAFVQYVNNIFSYSWLMINLLSKVNHVTRFDYLNIFLIKKNLLYNKNNSFNRKYSYIDKVG